MATLSNRDAGNIVLEIAKSIVENRAYLSAIDGKIGDGDHGVNMAKGFGMATERLKDAQASLSKSFAVLGDILMSEIGGSMGPLYGMMFIEFSDALGEQDEIDSQNFSQMLHAGLNGVQSIGNAKVGDKTLIDTLEPAIGAFDTAIGEGKSFAEALTALVSAAEAGRDSTMDLVAKIGRASRLGDRSLGVLDAGATSCEIILRSLASNAREQLIS